MASKRLSLGGTTNEHFNKTNRQSASNPQGKANFMQTRSRNFTTSVTNDYDANSSITKAGAIERYMNARARLTDKAKEHVEKLNKSAMDRIKYSALYERTQKQEDKVMKYRQDKVRERQRTYKDVKDQTMKSTFTEAFKSFKQ